MKTYRQGDVFLIALDKMPEGAIKEESKGDLILAYGEVTGHKHAIKSGYAEMYQWKGNTLIEVEKENTVLVHEEHAPIPLPQGIYEVRIQRQYSREWGSRNVTD